MRFKKFTMIAMMMSLILALTVVTAASSQDGFSLTIVNDLPTNIHPGSNHDLRVNLDNSNVTYSSVDVVLSGSDFSIPAYDGSVNYNSANDIDMTLIVPTTASGTFSRVLTAEIRSGAQIIATLDVTFDANVVDLTYCEDIGLTEGVGALEIKAFDISNSGKGDDDAWDLLDNIEIEIEVENTDSNNDVDDVFVEIKILDNSGNDVTNDFDLDDEKIDIGRIRDDDSEIVTFVIPEVPVDLDEGDYRLYVIAYSDDDDSCVSEGNDLDNYGSSKFYADFEVRKEFSNGIIVGGELTNLQVTCGQENVDVNFDLYNIGDSKEEKVLVTLVNRDLGVDEKVVIDNFRSGKKKDISFLLNLPNDMDKNNYNLEITTYFDYDDDEDELDIDAYDENSDDDLDESYSLRLDILGGCSGTDNPNGDNGDVINRPLISAELMSDNVVSGEEVVVKVVVSNPTNTRLNYVVSVTGYSDWATITSVQPSVLNVNAGDSEEVIVRLIPTETGVQTFSLEFLNSEDRVTQDVSLNVAGSKGFFDFSSFSDDAVLYWVAIALIVLIVFLILLILIVAIRRR